MPRISPTARGRFRSLEATLDRLAADGHRLAVCTNKLEWLSRRLLTTLKLTPYFAAICGQDTFGVHEARIRKFCAKPSCAPAASRQRRS